jgi:hypothetical protein
MGMDTRESSPPSIFMRTLMVSRMTSMKRLSFYAQMELYFRLRKAERQYVGQQYQQMDQDFWFMFDVENV